MESAGRGTGWMWRGTENRPGHHGTCPFPTRGVIAIMWSMRLQMTSLITSFIREQIAGDLLPAGSESERIEHLVATGFLAIGVKDVNQRFKVRFIMDNVDEQIDAVSRSFLGLTASCARCHDHKFDPIPTSDYYALAGIFSELGPVRWSPQQDGGRWARLLRYEDARETERSAQR